MAIKYALLALALFVAWMLLFRAARGISRPKRKPPAPPPAQELSPCPRCGVYRLPTGTCDCDLRSGPQD